MLKVLGAAAAALVLTFANAANAATLIKEETGTIGAGPVNTFISLPDFGSFEFEFASSAVPVAILVMAVGESTTDWYDINGVKLTSTVHPADFGMWTPPPNFSTLPFVMRNGAYTGAFVIPGLTRTDFPNGDYQEQRYGKNAINAIVYFDGADAGGTWSFKVSAVPEPATWAIMIVGFGLAGSALRRRRLALA